VGRLELLLGLKEKGDDLKKDYMKKTSYRERRRCV